MSMQATRPLSLLHVDFNDLYARHLGRHSQFGINVGHLASLYGLWYGAYAALYQAVLMVGVPSGWLIIVASGGHISCHCRHQCSVPCRPGNGGLPGNFRR